MSDLKISDRRLAPVSLTIFIIAVAVRLIHYNQSLWADEMNALVEYITGPWSKIVAPAAGEYVPNNHVLFTILAKCCFQIGGSGSRGLGSPVVAALIRLPSLLAGSMVPIALAWPMRRRAPSLAILIALFAALNPWLIAFSDEARGYSLMILLGIVATNLLPNDPRRWPVAYGVVIALAIYTVQVAAMLLPAHLLVVLMFRCRAMGTWLRGAIIAGLTSIVFLLPMSKGLSFYYQHPISMTADPNDFANQLPRFAFAGQYMPGAADALVHIPDFKVGLVYWLVPVFILLVGSGLAWTQPALKTPMIVMAAATLLFFVFILFDSQIAQVRFNPWCAVWLVLAMSAIADWVGRNHGMKLMALSVAIAASWFTYRDIALLPSQPVLQAMLRADDEAPPQVEIVMAMLTADDAGNIYGKDTVSHHHMEVATDPGKFIEVERSAIQHTGRRPWVIMSYEYLARDFGPKFWVYFQSHYQLQSRLAGRISPVAIYKPLNEDQSK